MTYLQREHHIFLIGLTSLGAWETPPWEAIDVTKIEKNAAHQS